MSDFRQMAERMDQHMQLLEERGITEDDAVINAMMGYVPELHRIWTGTTDEQLLVLTRAFPGFYRYAFIMESAFEREHQKMSRVYDGQPEIADRHKKVLEKILASAASIERGYMLIQDDPDGGIGRRNQLRNMYQAWQCDTERFRNSLSNDFSVTDMQRQYVDTVLMNIDGRICGLMAIYRSGQRM